MWTPRLLITVLVFSAVVFHDRRPVEAASVAVSGESVARTPWVKRLTCSFSRGFVDQTRFRHTAVFVCPPAGPRVVPAPPRPPDRSPLTPDQFRLPPPPHA